MSKVGKPKAKKPEKIRVYEDFLNVTKHVDDPISSIIETAEKLSKLTRNGIDLEYDTTLDIPPLLSSMKKKETLIERVMSNINGTQVSFKLAKFLHNPRSRRSFMDSAEFQAFAASKDAHHLISKYHLFKHFQFVK